jgi:hypothetical protein
MDHREITGVEQAEDMVAIPDTDWVITGAMSLPALERPTSFFVNTKTHELRPAWPDHCTIDLDSARFGDVKPATPYSFHGLDVIKRDSTIEVLAVNHAVGHGAQAGQGRESVEVFEVDLGTDGPSLRWRGAVLGPAWLNGNDLCALPEGGFAITNYCYPGPEATQMGVAGAICGNVLEWHNSSEGWRIVPGTDLNYPNGIALAPGGDAYFVAVWGLRKLVRVPRGNSSVERVEIPLPGLVDNITWTPDGAMLCCCQMIEIAAVWESFRKRGTVDAPFEAVRVDPVTLEAKSLIAEHVPDFFATTVLQVGEREVWASSLRGNRVLAFDL